MLVEALQPFSSFILWMSIFYVQCNSGDKVTNRHANLCNLIYSGSWIYSLNQRKIIILMIMNAQQAVYLEGVAAQCTRETFKKVKFIIIFTHEILL